LASSLDHTNSSEGVLNVRDGAVHRACFPPMQGTPETCYRIAVLEADELVRELLLRWLRDEGHQAVDLDDVTRLQAEGSFDVLIADVPSPRKAAEPVRLLRSVHDGPIVLVSARLRGGLGRSRELARDLGVSAMLPKPFTRQELLCVVDEAMRPI